MYTSNWLVDQKVPIFQWWYSIYVHLLCWKLSLLAPLLISKAIFNESFYSLQVFFYNLRSPGRKLQPNQWLQEETVCFSPPPSKLPWTEEKILISWPSKNAAGPVHVKNSHAYLSVASHLTGFSGFLPSHPPLRSSLSTHLRVPHQCVKFLFSLMAWNKSGNAGWMVSRRLWAWVIWPNSMLSAGVSVIEALDFPLVLTLVCKKSLRKIIDQGGFGIKLLLWNVSHFIPQILSRCLCWQDLHICLLFWRVWEMHPFKIFFRLPVILYDKID